MHSKISKLPHHKHNIAKQLIDKNKLLLMLSSDEYKDNNLAQDILFEYSADENEDKRNIFKQIIIQKWFNQYLHFKNNSDFNIRFLLAYRYCEVIASSNNRWDRNNLAIIIADIRNLMNLNEPISQQLDQFILKLCRSENENQCRSGAEIIYYLWKNDIGEGRKLAEKLIENISANKNIFGYEAITFFISYFVNYKPELFNKDVKPYIEILLKKIISTNSLIDKLFFEIKANSSLSNKNEPNCYHQLILNIETYKNSHNLKINQNYQDILIKVC